MSKRYYWLKLKESFFSEPKIKKLRKIAGGDTYTVIFQKIMLLSIKNQGIILFEGIENSLPNELALILDEDEDNVEITVEFMLRSGLLEEIEPSKFLVTCVPELIGSESQSAARVRKFRDNKKDEKESKTLQCNAEVTEVKRLCNKTVTPDIREKIEDKDIDNNNPPIIPPKGKNRFNKSLINQLDSSLHEIFEEYLDLRKQLKVKNTDRAVGLLISELKKHPLNEQKKMLENSIMHSWKSVYPLKLPANN
ncbi:phage replisome organizer N-terminal domain-containing protein [Thiotrichales bacterium 19X7-9]|nr:phage replisome organizer N-terminal domain-containing protein [Thiotrichales bacterium 19X7-9]